MFSSVATDFGPSTTLQTLYLRVSPGVGIRGQELGHIYFEVL